MTGVRLLLQPRVSLLGVPRGGASTETRQRFDELSRRLLRRAATLPSAPPAESRALFASGSSIEECLQMRRVAGPTGDVLVREVTHPLPQSILRGAGAVRADAQPVPSGDVVLIDLETAGLANAPVVLAGCAFIESGVVRVRQILAETYPAEETLLIHVAREIGARPTVVTFNGGTFDLPMIYARSALYRVGTPRPGRHIDLLSLARRAYTTGFENRRLSTLESRVLGRERVGDLPSREVPALFHRFLRSGEPADVAPIIRHNDDDLVSMAGLAIALGAVRDVRARDIIHGEDIALSA